MSPCSFINMTSLRTLTTATFYFSLSNVTSLLILTIALFPRRDANRHFRNKKKAYLKAKIEELETNSKIHNVSDLYRDISDYKKGYQPRTIIV